MTEQPEVKRIDFLGVPLDTGVSIDDVCDLLRYKNGIRLVTFVNPITWAIKRKNAGFVPMLKAMSLVLPDGGSVALSCRFLTKLPCQRLSFDNTSVAAPFFATCVAENARVMLVGGQPGVDEDTHLKLANAQPNLQIVGTTHGYGDYGSKIAQIMTVQPDVVVVGMGSPRQEEFLIALRDAGYQGYAITCGGFFDQYLESETDHYYPQWINKYNLRFAWRLYKEPRRLWRRYLIDYQVFVWIVIEAIIRKVIPAKPAARN